MANEKLIELAVASLAAFVSDGLPDELRTVETARGYDPGALVNPVAYVRARLPADNRSPLVQVYAEGAKNIGSPRQRLWSVDCTMILGFSGDADVEKGEAHMNGYLTALEELFNDGAYTLGDTVNAAWLHEIEPAVTIGDKSATRHVCALGVEVHVQVT